MPSRTKTKSSSDRRRSSSPRQTSSTRKRRLSEAARILRSNRTPWCAYSPFSDPECRHTTDPYQNNSYHCRFNRRKGRCQPRYLDYDVYDPFVDPYIPYRPPPAEVYDPTEDPVPRPAAVRVYKPIEAPFVSRPFPPIARPYPNYIVP